jgi:thiol-disulfide isomerase/thioredoxin
MPMRIGDPVPEFDGATEWLNGQLEDAVNASKGSPLLVHFWAVSCGICKEKMPQLKELEATFRPHGLKTVAVHMPRYEVDTNMDSVREAINTNKISEVCAVDNKHKLKDAFKNEQGWVPVYYLFDSEGKLKTRAAGEFGVGVLKTSLERMFADRVSEASA